MTVICSSLGTVFTPYGRRISVQYHIPQRLTGIPADYILTAVSLEVIEMDYRQERGLKIAALAKIERNPLGWQVPSQSGNGSYVVKIDGDKFCTCPDFADRRLPCKHIYAVEFVIQREANPDGTTTYTQAVRVTYAQKWTAYNSAQVNEEDWFGRLLRDLCEKVPQPPQTFGRPRLPKNDVVFALASKVYSGMSGRRFSSALRGCKEQGLIQKAPHYNSAFRYLEDASLTPILKSLIEVSAAPLSAVESSFAVDSSGFATSVYDRWFDHKYGKERREAKWVKAHLMCGVTTHVVTSVEVTPTESADAPFLPGLVATAADSFDVVEVSADKAYSSRKNLHAINAVGATPYIPFKERSVETIHEVREEITRVSLHPSEVHVLIAHPLLARFIGSGVTHKGSEPFPGRILGTLVVSVTGLQYLPRIARAPQALNLLLLHRHVMTPFNNSASASAISCSNASRAASGFEAFVI